MPKTSAKKPTGSAPKARKSRGKKSVLPDYRLSPEAIEGLANATFREPRSVLGYHEITRENEQPLSIVRVLEPDAVAVEVFWEDAGDLGPSPLDAVHPAGVFEGRIPYRRPLTPYRLRVRYRDGNTALKHDPYFFSPQLSDYDLHLFGQGCHYRIWSKLGAHALTLDGVAGTHFAVWAPNAERVSVVGPFNLWDGRKHLMHARGTSGVWELFIPDLPVGTRYKFELHRAGRSHLKADPYGFAMELRPGNCSIVASVDGFEWSDQAWIEARQVRSAVRAAINIYEVHVGSWRRPQGREPAFLNWSELGDQLIPYACDMGYTHIELMGVAEHPLDASWGYQVTGYYAPTARFGSPVDFMRFVDRAHAAGLGVIMDWVPAHFPKDDHGLVGFDGTALYEHADPRQGEHRDWGTKIFNYGRREVQNFLIGNALYWLQQFHIDGLRVDAVASMLYLDYSRAAGDWLPNRFGGRENLEAIDFLRHLNQAVSEQVPGALMIAEESTAFPGVTQPTHLGGLGFTFKWNMGWMNDTLRYMSLDPVYRSHEHRLITFSFVYAWSEKFLLPISHDEVVHGKKSLLAKMPGDEWQQRANDRLFMTYMTVHPGKKLLFMGCEFGQWHEWRESGELDWALLGVDAHRQLRGLQRSLNHVYKGHAALHGSDADGDGFAWIEVQDAANSVFAFERRATAGDSGEPFICVFNATPVPREHYRVGVDASGCYETVIDSDERCWGGSGYLGQRRFHASEPGAHGRRFALSMSLPPLGALILRRVDA